jgi:hypothetical protein
MATILRSGGVCMARRAWVLDLRQNPGRVMLGPDPVQTWTNSACRACRRQHVATATSDRSEGRLTGRNLRRIPTRRSRGGRCRGRLCGDRHGGCCPRRRWRRQGRGAAAGQGNCDTHEHRAKRQPEPARAFAHYSTPSSSHHEAIVNAASHPWSSHRNRRTPHGVPIRPLLLQHTHGMRQASPLIHAAF